MIKYSVIVPVFNEQDNIIPLYSRLVQSLKDYEIIFVDDGSTDGSIDVLKSLISENVKIIRLTRNFGQFQAIMAGFRICKGDVIITIDADLQNPPEEISKLLRKIDEGYEIVFGSPVRKNHSFYRRLGSSTAKWVLSKILRTKNVSFSGFRALKSNVVKNLLSLEESYKFIDAMACWMGYRAISVDVEHDERHSGKSKYSLFKLINLCLDMIISFTNIPLKIAIFGGLILGGLGFILVIGYIVMYFVQSYTVPGFVSTVILISLFSGIQLFCLGIIGEYIGRINLQVRKRPDYIIREIL